LKTELLLKLREAVEELTISQLLHDKETERSAPDTIRNIVEHFSQE